MLSKYTEQEKRDAVKRYNSLKKAGYGSVVIKKRVKHNINTIKKYAEELGLEILL